MASIGRGAAARLVATIIATALPTIVGDLGGLLHLSWVVTKQIDQEKRRDHDLDRASYVIVVHHTPNVMVRCMGVNAWGPIRGQAGVVAAVAGVEASAA